MGDGKRNLIGWLALVFGIIGTGCCCCPLFDGTPFFGGIPALILGILHLQRVKKRQATMPWLGWAGIILAIAALLGAILQITTGFDDRIQDEFDNMNN